jgi:hypothetical protein
MWTGPGEMVVDRERHTVQSPTFMLTVVWNPIGFHVLKALPKGRRFNAQYNTNDILVAISDWRRQIGGTRPNKLWGILIMLGHTQRKCQEITSVSIE